MRFDEKNDYLLKKDFKLADGETPYQNIDFRETFKPGFVFKKNEQGRYPLKFLFWDKAGEPLVGYIDGVICGKRYKVSSFHDYSESGHVAIGIVSGDVECIHVEPVALGNAVRLSSEAKNTTYTAYLSDNVLVIEAVLQK